MPRAMEAMIEMVTPSGISNQPRVPKKSKTAAMFGKSAITPIFQERKRPHITPKIRNSASNTLLICPEAMLFADSLVRTAPPVKVTSR